MPSLLLSILVSDKYCELCPTFAWGCCSNACWSSRKMSVTSVRF